MNGPLTRRTRQSMFAQDFINYYGGFYNNREKFRRRNRQGGVRYVYTPDNMVPMQPFVVPSFRNARRQRNNPMDRYDLFNSRGYRMPTFGPMRRRNERGFFRNSQFGTNEPIKNRKNNRFNKQRQRYSKGPNGKQRSGQRSDNRQNGRRGKSNKIITEDTLNADLDEYMGGDLAKTRLDNQLDSYFGRSGNTDLESRTMITLDPLNDPSDIAMDEGNSHLHLNATSNLADSL